MIEAMFYEKLEGGGVICRLCPNECKIPAGKHGICGVRVNTDGVLYGESYGEVCAMALDPIEKKPLRRFLPGSLILSIGGYGCNLHCPFCQNHEISVIKSFGRATSTFVSAEELSEKALKLCNVGNIGVAYTYNEAFIAYEYLMECSVLCHEKGLKNVVVTNGYINAEPLLKILPFVDAMNIDLKSFNPKFYREVGGDLDKVKSAIEIAARHCHLELTTLIIPGKNDGVEEMEALSRWVSDIDKNIPLHITRFRPRYHMEDTPEATIDMVNALKVVAAENLKYIY